MAKASAKRVAGNNDQYLANLTKGMVGVNVTALLLRLLFPLIRSRSTIFPGYASALVNISAFVVSVGLYNHLNAVGAPRKDPGTGRVVQPGADLDAPGLLEFVWDTIYITWLCQLLSALPFPGGKAWYLYLAVPGIACWKLYTIAKPFLNSMRGGGGGGGGPASSSSSSGQVGVPAAVGGGEGRAQAQEGEPTSKRQAKLKARMDRGDKRVQQVERRRPA